MLTLLSKNIYYEPKGVKTTGKVDGTKTNSKKGGIQHNPNTSPKVSGNDNQFDVNVNDNDNDRR